jgi:serine/threonine-protein kinase
MTMIGRTISHYAILDKLGEGGMGVVYKARDVKLNRLVALKFMPGQAQLNEEDRQRFLQEAQSAALLNHPNVCTIHDIRDEGDDRFIVMEFVDGRTLRSMVYGAPGQKLDEVTTIGIAVQIGDALAEAHRHGIVHRDVKADNIMVNARGHVKVMDFGLAKLKGSMKLTRDSSTLGTLAYMAPEQLRAEEVDARSDIFSYGVLLFEMLTGRMPFRGEHEAAMMYTIMNEAPEPVSKYSPDVSPDVERIIERALEKDPADRYQHIDDLVSELRRLQKKSGRVGRPVSGAEVPVPDFTGRDSGPVSAGRPSDRPVSGVQGAGAGPKSASGPASSSIASPESAPAAGRKRRNLLAGAIVLAVNAVIAVYFVFFYGTHKIDSLAVLPFQNGTGESEKEYLTEGLADNVVNKISKLSGLRVVPRSMTRRYAGKEADPVSAGKDLGVGAVLTGNVVQTGDGLIVQAELIDVAKESQIWGERYERKMSDLINVQEDIVRSVTERLGAKTTDAERRTMAAGRTENAGAYQLYLKGRYYWNKRTAEGGRMAMSFFWQAIAADPNYALAYVGIADGYLTGAMNTPPAGYMPKVKQAVTKALELDENLAEAHASMATVKMYYEFDFAGSERELRRAIELNPNYPTVHHWLGEFLVFMGRFDEGFAEYEKARTLDPVSMPIESDYGIAHYFARRYDRSIELLKKAIATEPSFVRSHFYIMYPLMAQGRRDEAFRELTAGMNERGDSSGVIREVEEAYRREGFPGIAKLELRSGERFDEETRKFDLALSYLELGDKGAALDFLEKAYEERQYHVVTLKADPAWDPLRSEPRFIALMKKVGF